MNSNPVHPLKYSVHMRLREFHLKRLISDFPKGRLLDVGCGLGYLIETLGQNYNCVGMEYDIHALKTNRDRGLVHIVQGDATKLPFEDGVFDVVICSEVLEHLPDGVDEKALNEIVRILKPGGRLLITVPSLEGIRAKSTLRNIGHDDPTGGEYHYRIGYAWKDIKEIIDRVSFFKLLKRRYSMFLFSEIFMDLLKLVYLKKNAMKEHSDIMEVKDSFIFRMYRLIFPFLHFLFVCEDVLLASIFKGHILILELERKIDREGVS